MRKKNIVESKLREIRLACLEIDPKYRQSDVASAIPIDVAAYSRWETEIYLPANEYADKLVKYFRRVKPDIKKEDIWIIKKEK